MPGVCAEVLSQQSLKIPEHFGRGGTLIRGRNYDMSWQWSLSGGQGRADAFMNAKCVLMN